MRSGPALTSQPCQIMAFGEVWMRQTLRVVRPGPAWMHQARRVGMLLGMWGCQPMGMPDDRPSLTPAPAPGVALAKALA